MPIRFAASCILVVLACALLSPKVLAQSELGGDYQINTTGRLTLRLLSFGVPIAQSSTTTAVRGTARTVVQTNFLPGSPNDLFNLTIASGRIEAFDFTADDATLNLLGVQISLANFRFRTGDCFGNPGPARVSQQGTARVFIDHLSAEAAVEGTITAAGGTPPFAFNTVVNLADEQPPPRLGLFNIYEIQSNGAGGVVQRVQTSPTYTDQFRFGAFDFEFSFALADGSNSIDLLSPIAPTRFVCCPDRLSAGDFHDSGGAGEIPLGFGLRATAAADLNGDGRTDFAAINNSFGHVDIVLATGPGTFAAPVSVPLDSFPQDVAAGDLDNDGDNDLVTVHQVSNVLDVLLNNGDGTFAPRTSFPIDPSATSLTLGDIDGDGDLDIVHIGNPLTAPNVFVSRNTGTGTFAAPEAFRSGNTPADIALGDIDGDGDLDMVLPLRFADFLGFRRNDGLGNFTNVVGFNLLPSGGDGPISVVLFDGDGDGDLDISTANITSNNITYLRNNNGLFSNATLTAFPLTAAIEPASIVAGDLDGDGDRDLAIGSSPGSAAESGGVNVLKNNGAGVFNVTPPVNHPLLGARARQMLASDVDQDGDLDLVATTDPFGFEQDHLTILLNDCTGPALPQCPADFNQDGEVNPDDLGDFINCFFGVPPCNQADFNADGDVNPDDLGDYINAFFGPPC